MAWILAAPKKKFEIHLKKVHFYEIMYSVNVMNEYKLSSVEVLTYRLGLLRDEELKDRELCLES